MPRIKICRLKQYEVSSGPRKVQISCGILSTALFLTITRYPLKVRKVSQYPFCLSLCKRSLILRMELVFSEKTSFMNQKFCSFSCDEKGAKAEPRACYTQKCEHTHTCRGFIGASCLTNPHVGSPVALLTPAHQQISTLPLNY